MFRANVTFVVEETESIPAATTTKAPEKEFKKYFLGQLADHFNRENGIVWSQPYYQDLSYIEGNNSAIFFELGGEWNIEEHFKISKTPFGGQFTFDLAKKYKVYDI